MQKIAKCWEIKRNWLILCFSIFMVLGMQYTLHKEFGAVKEWILSYPQYAVVTVFFVAGIYYSFSGLLSFGIATVLMSIITWGWSVINYIKFTMREEYVIGDDVISFFKGELTFAKEDITFSKHLLYFGIPVLLMVVSGFFFEHRWKSKKSFYRKWYMRSIRLLIGILITVFFGFVVYFTENIHDYMSNGEVMEKKYGLALSFIPNNTLPHLVTNADYTKLFDKEYVREGYKRLSDCDGTYSGKRPVKDANEEKSEYITPNIIVIMSESLYDTDNFDNVKADKNPMDIMHRYQRQYGGGSMAVDIFGGGTANTEFEFLTGMGHKYFASNLMYNNYIMDGQMSMVGYMKQLGYRTVSIHPYKENFFNRKRVYKSYGFDESYFMENMTYTDDMFDVNISDYSLTKEIIEKYENSGKDKPFFNFSVSVGAHKPCLDYDKGEPYKYKVRVKALPDEGNFNYGVSMDVRRYFSAVYDANAAFKELTDYFENVSEPTVILLFADHAPPLSDLAYEQITKEDLTDEELYKTPVVTWNNYGLPKFNADNVNANYLSAMFLSYLDFPLPKACIYNQNIMKYYYSTNTKVCVKDTNGKAIKEFTKEEMELEKASLSLYQDELKMKENVLDIWDVPDEDNK